MTNFKSVIKPISRMVARISHHGGNAASQVRRQGVERLPEHPGGLASRSATGERPPERPRASGMVAADAPPGDQTMAPRPNPGLAGAEPPARPPRHSKISALRSHLGLNRLSVETPISQSLHTPHRRNLGVRAPLQPRPAGGQAAVQATRQPPPAPDAVPGDGAAAIGAAFWAEQGIPSSDHLMADAMEQADPDMVAVIEHQFSGVTQPWRPKVFLREALQAWQPDPACAPPELPGLPRVLMTQALAAATGADTALSVAALGALRQLDPLQELAAAWQRHPQRAQDSTPGTADDAHDPVAKAAAWRVAMELGTTPSGLAVLQSAMARPVPPEHLLDFALWLKAAAGLLAAPATPAPHSPAPQTAALPASMLDSAAEQPSVAGLALACATARLAGHPEEGRPHDWALNAVRNDLYATGAGSDFAAIDARLMKMGRSIDLAAHDTAFTLRNPMAGKSAFRALRHGVREVDRGPAIARHRGAFETALRSAALGLQKHLLEAPARQRVGPASAPKALLRAAVLAHCATLPAPASMDRHRFDSDAALSDVVTRLADMLGMPDMPVDARSHLLGQVRAMAGEPMTLERLQRWLADAEKASPGHPPGTAAEPGTAWNEPIRTHLARARDEAAGGDTRVRRVTRERIKTSLKHIVKNIEGSSRLRLSSGGIVAVGLKQVSSTLSALASGLFVRARLDARKQWGRQAVFEIAMPPYDMEIVIGTQTQSAVQLGAGVALGPDLGVAKVTLAGIDGLAYGSERSGITGISLRLPRIGRPVSELREEFSRLLDRLLDGTDRDANRQEPLLKQLLQEFPQLTVNRIGEAGEGRRRHGAAAEVGPSVSLPFFKASATAGAAVEAQRGYTKFYRDATGSLRVERQIDGEALRGSVAGKVAVGLSVDTGGATLSAGNTDVTLLGGSADVLVAGSARRREAVYQDTRLHPISFVETEYQNVETFLGSMAPHLDQWAQARVDARSTQGNAPRDVDTERAKVQDFLAQIHQQATATHTFAARYTIKPGAAARIDGYRSAAMLAARHPVAAQQQAGKAFDAGAEWVWRQPASVQPYSLRSYKRSMAQDSMGPNLLVQVATLNAADASHIDNRLDVG